MMRDIEALKEHYKAGTEVVFDGFGVPDPYSMLRPGTRGVVTLVDDAGTVHVRWEGGGNLGMVLGRFPSDRIRKVRV